MAEIVLQHIYKRYDDGVPAIQDFNLEIKDKEFIIFVGPSGCGKSTTLRMIAGLEEISGGELWIDGVKMNEVEASDRDIAMVFQNYALYPHMTVYDNIAYSLKLKKMPKKVIDEKVKETAKVLELLHLLDRKPAELSGGQKQRVAMGRAMVRNPKAFLMDEPLSNLDAKLRTIMRGEIAKWYKELGTTFIYVTHDQTEAMTLGTRIVVMKEGIVQQIASPAELYQKPDNLFVAGFIGSPQMNFFPAKCVMKEGEVCCLNIAGRDMEIPRYKQVCLEEEGYMGKEVIVGIRPEDFSMEQHDKTEYPDNVLEVTTEIYEMLGADALIHFTQDGAKMTAKVDGEIKAQRGDRMEFVLKPHAIHVFDKETEKAIVH